MSKKRIQYQCGQSNTVNCHKMSILVTGDDSAVVSEWKTVARDTEEATAPTDNDVDAMSSPPADGFSGDTPPANIIADGNIDFFLHVCLWLIDFFVSFIIKYSILFFTLFLLGKEWRSPP